MVAELVTLPPAVADLPDPKEFGEILLARLNGEIMRIRAQRGPVVDAADAYALIRSLKGFDEVMRDYARQMTSAAKVAVQEIEEELLGIPGMEQDGVPTGPLTVPDTDGTDIKITVDNQNEHFIDLDVLKEVVAAVVATDVETGLGVVNLATAVALTDDHIERGVAANALGGYLAQMVISGVDLFLTTGTYKAQVTKVKALGKRMASEGADGFAAMVARAIKTNKVYRGVKVDRVKQK